MIRMLPIWSTGILLVTASAHQNTFAIQQARTMNRHLSPSFQIPPATMSVFNVLTMLISVVAYDRIFVPVARRFTGNPAGITYLQRMGIGLAVSVLSTVAAGVVEVKRKGIAAHYGLIDHPKAVIPMSVFWLVPQYSLHGVAEAFMQVGHMEFLYDQAPESMRSTAAALYWLAISAGNYLNTLLVFLIHKYSGKERNWLPDRNINRGRLDWYYWLVTGVQVVNLVYYMVCAWFYTYKPLKVVGLDDPCKRSDDAAADGGHLELAANDKCMGDDGADQCAGKFVGSECGGLNGQKSGPSPAVCEC